jgi:hypothetical protein
VARISSSMILMISAMFVVFGSIAIAAQDKYTLKSGKLANSPRSIRPRRSMRLAQLDNLTASPEI